MENLNNHIENEVLWKLLANPAEINYSQIFTLQLLVDDFPQSGVLRALRVTKNDEQNVQHAVAYFNPAVLYKLVNANNSLAVVTPDKVAYIDPALTKLNKAAAAFIANESGHDAIKADLGVPNGGAATENQIQHPIADDNHIPVGIETAVTLPDVLAHESVEQSTAEVQPVILQKVEAAPEITHQGPLLEDKPAVNADIYHDPLDEMEFKPFVWGDEYKTEPKVEQHLYTAEVDKTGHDATHELNEVVKPDNLPVEARENLIVVPEVHKGSHAVGDAHAPIAEMEKPTVSNIENPPADAGALPLLAGELSASGENEQATAVAHEAEAGTHFTPELKIEEHAVDEQGHGTGLTDEGLVVPAPHEAVYAQSSLLMDDEEEDNQVYNYSEKTEYFQQDTADEIYDEIVSIEDINLEQLAAFNAEFGIIDQNETEEAVGQIAETTANPITATDHFVFEHGITQNGAVEPISAPVSVATAADDEIREEPVEQTDTDNDTQEVTNYHDDKLPYTFMWWLDKTRKKYASTYQPYVNNNGAQPVKKPRVDELQQQYVESIYSVTLVDELEKTSHQKAGITLPRKEDKIIERFIQAEPQIQHSGATKLDNENKARKSSEDRDEFVTETLARIYTEQMLYQKAIAVYKKMMLKIPEKSLYFASQIEQLEKKYININKCTSY